MKITGFFVTVGILAGLASAADAGAGAKLSPLPTSDIFADIRRDDTAAVAADLERGAAVDTRNSAGSTLLMIAAGLGHADIVRLLLERGADIHALDAAMGVSALHRAAQSGNVAILDMLLGRGAFLDDRSAVNGHTPLLDAAFYKRYAAFELLLARGADARLKNTLGLDAWDWARRQQDARLVELLEVQARRDAELEASQELIAAARANDVPRARIALQRGDAVDQIAKDGNSPLLIAARNGFTELVALLLDAGANPNLRDRVMRATPGHKAAFFGYTQILRLLVDHGLDVNLQGPYNGYTALHDAILNGHLEAARLLIGAGASSTIEGIDGKSPRQLACDLDPTDCLGLFPASR